MSKIDIAIYSIIIGLSVVLAWQIVNIWRYDQQTISEPNITILTIETGFLLLALTFGVLKRKRDAKRKKR